jgi:hypothetical protein
MGKRRRPEISDIKVKLTQCFLMNQDDLFASDASDLADLFISEILKASSVTTMQSIIVKNWSTPSVPLSVEEATLIIDLLVDSKLGAN